VVICLERGADCLHVVQLMPLPSQTPSSLASFKSDWFYHSGTGLPRLSWKRGVVVEVVYSSVSVQAADRCDGHARTGTATNCFAVHNSTRFSEMIQRSSS